MWTLLDLLITALTVGGAFLLLSVGLLVVFVMYKLPRLPPEIDSKGRVRLFLIQNGLFMLYIHLKSKLNGKPFIVNSRKAMDKLLPPKPSIVKGSNIRSLIRDFDGVRVRIYEPIFRENIDHLPGLVFIHGGGFIGGSADQYDTVTRKLADVIGGVVVSIDYRLAPENPFPAGYEDCLTATKYFFRNTSEYLVDPSRVAICGDSAGANLAAGVVQELCSKTSEGQGTYKPKLQILLYPLLQLLDLQTPSYQRHNAAFGVRGGFLPSSSVSWMVPHYLEGKKNIGIMKSLMDGSLVAKAISDGDDMMRDTLTHAFVPPELKCSSYKKPSDSTTGAANSGMWERFKPFVQDPRVMPLYKNDLRGLPPAYILTCDFDILRDDGVMYAERLKEAGVDVTLVNCIGALHGLLFFPQFKWGHSARKNLYTHLKSSL